MWYPTHWNMTTPQSQDQAALALLKRNGLMRLSELRKAGIHPPTLSRLVAKGRVVRPSRGLYQRADAELVAGQSLAEAAKRVPKGVICLVSALAFHGITLQLPRSVWIAIGAKDRKPAPSGQPLRTVRFGPKAMTAGIETHVIGTVPVRIFDPAKTVVDCFRYRKAIGLDVAIEALRMSLRSGKARPAAIAAYARELRIASVIRPYLESLSADGS